MSPDAQMTMTMVELADRLVDDFDVVDLLTSLSDHCVDVLDAQAAGVMLVSPGGDLRVIASSSAVMRGLELFEEQADEGPCQDCYRTGEPVLNTKLAAVGDRWPHFAPRALDAGFRSAHALPMHLRDTTIGALNLFRADEGELDHDEVTLAQGFADIATLAVVQHRAASDVALLNERLSGALNSRVAIEQAKGVIAERTGLEMDQTFTRLRKYATLHEVRLVDVARAIVDGTLEPAALDSRP
jgi:GAF domain-containing protein